MVLIQRIEENDGMGAFRYKITELDPCWHNIVSIKVYCQYHNIDLDEVLSLQYGEFMEF